MAGTWMPCSPSRDHRPMTSATRMTPNIVHHVTPKTVATIHATLSPSTTAAMRWALADRERTMVRSTTSRAAIGA